MRQWREYQKSHDMKNFLEHQHHSAMQRTNYYSDLFNKGWPTVWTEQDITPSHSFPDRAEGQVVSLQVLLKRSRIICEEQTDSLIRDRNSTCTEAALQGYCPLRRKQHRPHEIILLMLFKYWKLRLWKEYLDTRVLMWIRLMSIRIWTSFSAAVFLNFSSETSRSKQQ